MKSKTVLDVFAIDLGFPGWMDRWYQQAEEFEKAHPEYHVKVRRGDFWTFPLDVAEAVADGYRPALAEYYFYCGQVARDARTADGRPLFTSVERAIAGRTEILGEPVVLADVHPAYRAYYSLNGDLTSMPSVGTTSLLYANADLLDAAGVSELPQTWAEVEAVCAAVRRLPNGPARPITWSNHGTFFQQALASQGGLLVDNDNGRSGRATTANLSSKEIMTWVEWWRRLHRDGHYLYTGSRPDWAGTLRAFAEQKVAIRISSSNDVNYMAKAAEDNGFTIAVGIFPYNDQVPYVGNAVAGTSIWLADGLDEATQDGALAFLQYLHSPRNAAERHKANSFVPMTGASYRLLESEGWFDRYPYHRVAGDHVTRYPSQASNVDGNRRAGTPPSLGAVFGDFAGNQDVMTQAMGDVLAGADPAARFAQATDQAQKLLDEYNAWALRPGPRSLDSIPNSSHRIEFFTDVAPYSADDLERVVRLGR
jgi:sn-glycerol 3-phosphate transport system substrate-binding protein